MKKIPIMIIAGNFQEAHQFASNSDMEFNDWEFVQTPEMMAGYLGDYPPSFIFVGSWSKNPAVKAALQIMEGMI